MKKKSIVTLIVLFTVVCCTRYGYCSEQTPEQFVHDFYEWYFKADQGEDSPGHSDEIYNFVSKKTVGYAREEHTGVYYFTRVAGQLGDEHAVVGKAIPVNKDIFIVPVTFEKSKERIVVILRKENGRLYITKVMDIYPHL